MNNNNMNIFAMNNTTTPKVRDSSHQQLSLLLQLAPFLLGCLLATLGCRSRRQVARPSLCAIEARREQGREVAHSGVQSIQQCLLHESFPSLVGVVFGGSCRWRWSHETDLHARHRIADRICTSHTLHRSCAGRCTSRSGSFGRGNESSRLTIK